MCMKRPGRTIYWTQSYLQKKNYINNEETAAQYIAAKRQVKRIVKQEKRNKELSIARICKHNPKSFYFYINERRIVRDNIGPLKTEEGVVITTVNDMANIMENYFSSMFTLEQLNNLPQLIIIMKVLSTSVLEKLQHSNIWRATMSTGATARFY